MYKNSVLDNQNYAELKFQKQGLRSYGMKQNYERN